MRFLLFLVCLSALVVADDEKYEKLLKLKKLYELDLIDKNEYIEHRDAVINDMLLTKEAESYKHYVKVYEKGSEAGANWTMPTRFTPQTDWLLKIFQDSMPRSYDDILPYGGGKSFWKSHNYISEGAMDYNKTRLPMDSQIAIQERALTHVGLNIYDGSVWALALTLSGMVEIVDVYHMNVLYTSSTGANPQIGGLKSARAWEPNPDPKHPPDLFYYGRDKISNVDIDKVTLPANHSFIMFKEGCDCPTSGCCEQVFEKEIPGNFFYRMIGPTYIMRDPLQGAYGWTWRAEPAGINPDPAQFWNLAGLIHWNDWKPITGENVWGIILGPIQILFVRNCSHVKEFKTFEDAPYEVQLAVSVLPAALALKSPLGSMYHCPEGTKMFPPDEDEATNVSNENNFSAYAAFKALSYILNKFYKGSDPVLDKAKQISKEMLDGLEGWFAKYLLPTPIAGEHVISQGGHVTFDGTYKPQDGDQAFAVDCQTWGLLTVGAHKFDKNYGSKTTAYAVWQATKKLAGYYIDGKLAGVGYTTPSNETKNNTGSHDIWSGEWTWGAVFMCRRLARDYSQMGKAAWAQSLLADADSMVKLMNTSVIPCDDGVWCKGGLVQSDGSYLYANKRFFIPWGWYANPIGATASTGWAVFNDFHYNPFQLGGTFNTTGNFWQTQCKNNTPTPGILAELEKYYNE
jgi:hypothetical protein